MGRAYQNRESYQDVKKRYDSIKHHNRAASIRSRRLDRQYRKALGAYEDRIYYYVTGVIFDACGDRSYMDNIDVRVRVNTRIRFKMERDSYTGIEINVEKRTKPLKWEWNCKFTERIAVDTGSWSGLEVTAPDDIAELRTDVNVLEALNEMAKSDDIISFYTSDERPDSKDFYNYGTEYGHPIAVQEDYEIIDISESIEGTDMLIRSNKCDAKRYVGYKIEKYTPKQLYVSKYVLDYSAGDLVKLEPVRIYKDRFAKNVNYPITVEPEQEVLDRCKAVIERIKSEEKRRHEKDDQSQRR